MKYYNLGSTRIGNNNYQIVTVQQKKKYRKLFFRPGQSSNGKGIVKGEHSNMYINIATFNCKNILNSSNCIKTLQKLAHVICLQEHWLFNFEQNLAEKMTSNLKFKIKSVDDKNPIPSTQKPRGYGGYCNCLEERD